jgi:hypothetical protein
MDDCDIDSLLIPVRVPNCFGGMLGERYTINEVIEDVVLAFRQEE